jgi:hypothetical protein
MLYTHTGNRRQKGGQDYVEQGSTSEVDFRIKGKHENILESEIDPGVICFLGKRGEQDMGKMLLESLQALADLDRTFNLHFILHPLCFNLY